MDYIFNPCPSVKSVVSDAVSGPSATSAAFCKIRFEGCLGSQSAFIRACQPEPWRRLVISGKIISSVASVASCKMLPAESFRVFRVFRG